MWICPACNGLIRLTVPCHRCSILMEDKGMIEDYAQPYSPYDIDDELGGPVAATDTFACHHLVVCPQCREDRQIMIPFRFT